MNRKYDVTFPILKLNDFSNKSIKTSSSTYREGGIRLQAELINDKYIYHNYGQGESEISLAFGCAYIVSKMITLKKQDTKTKDVAVIGGSVNALMTALQLSKRGHKVKLYTTLNSSKNRASENSFGLSHWYSCDYDNCDPLKHELVSKLSFEFLQDCISTNRYQSIKPVNLFCSGPKGEQVLQNITDFISKQIGQVNVCFDNQKVQQQIFFRTVLIDTDLFIDEIFTQLRLRNVPVEQKGFSTLNEVLQLKEEFIYNCLGIQNRVIFGDKKVSEIQNFNISIPNPNQKLQQQAVFYNSSQNQQQTDYAIYLTKKKIQISSKSKLNQNLTDKLEQSTQNLALRAYHYLKERTTKPFKL